LWTGGRRKKLPLQEHGLSELANPKDIHTSVRLSSLKREKNAVWVFWSRNVGFDSRVKDGRRQDCVNGGALERRTTKKEGRKGREEAWFGEEMKINSLKNLANAHADGVWAVAWAPATQSRGALLITGSVDETVKLWKGDELEPERTNTGFFPFLSLSPPVTLFRDPCTWRYLELSFSK
jgi:WD40 repeat protein